MMQKTDKLLIGIVVAIVILVLVALGVALTRPKPTYQDDSEPAGVAFNYLFALQQKDYRRAYGYLSPTLAGYPADVAAFESDLLQSDWAFQTLNDPTRSLSIGSTNTYQNTATVEMRQTYFEPSNWLGASQQTTISSISLQQDEQGAWKITDASNFWVWCWSTVCNN